MSGQKHPDTEALAGLQAGLVGGLRGKRIASHVAGCARCASVSEQLGALPAVLAAVPAPALPDAFEQRITAALAAEVAARDTARERAVSTSGLSPAAAGAPENRGAADRVGSHRRPRPARARGLRLRPAIAFAPVLAGLLAGVGYVLSDTGSTVSQTAAGEHQALSKPAAAASAPASSSASAAAGSALAPADYANGTFIVTHSDTNYLAGTLATQVRSTVLKWQGGLTNAPAVGASGPAVPSAAPSASGTSLSSGSGSATSNARETRAAPALVGCVKALTGKFSPLLVDQASYQGRPAYVIVTATKAWVVGLGCTAGDTEVITTVTLSAAP
jgi:hypothetical protein